MNRKLLLVVPLCLALLSGCNPDEDIDMPVPEETAMDKILGTWKVDSTRTIPESGGSGRSGASSIFGGFYHFHNGGSLYITDDEELQNTAYFEFDVKEQNNKTTLFTYDTELHESYTYEVTALSETQMVWHYINPDDLADEYGYFSKIKN